MGQSRSRLRAPVLDKESEDGSTEDLGLFWGVSSMQGWRSKMEDAHVTLPSLVGNGWEDTALFAVMDGHGGAEVAKFCSHYIAECVSEGWSTDVEGSLRTAFLTMDEMLRDPPASSTGYGCRSFRPDSAGCTACACCVRNDQIVVANCGDSRAVLCRGGKAVALSHDHKPNNPEESHRIHKAGGFVQQETHSGTETIYRVNGDLALSRAIGDLDYKTNEHLPAGDQIISAEPDVISMPRQQNDEFMVLACDGIWEVLTNEEVVEFVRHRLQNKVEPLSLIMEELLDYIISPNPSKTRGLGGDNMTAILVVFDQLTTVGPISSGMAYSDAQSDPDLDDCTATPTCHLGPFF